MIGIYCFLDSGTTSVKEYTFSTTQNLICAVLVVAGGGGGARRMGGGGGAGALIYDTVITNRYLCY